MVDFNTYKQLHSNSGAFKRNYSSTNDTKLKRMDPIVMDADDNPRSPEIYVFPETIIGYNLRSKKWGMCSTFIKVFTFP
jgi:hypothetical protein